MSAQKALETIGGGLQKQYERWQPRARYKQSLDPTVDEVKKLCMSLRRNAKVRIILFLGVLAIIDFMQIDWLAEKWIE